MELATLITETVRLSDEAHRANNAGHPSEAMGHLDKLRVLMLAETSAYEPDPEPETEPAPESPAPEHTSDGD